MNNFYLSEFQKITESLGISPQVNNIIVFLISLSFLVAMGIILDKFVKHFMLIFVGKIINKTKLRWDTILLEKKVFNSLAHIFPIVILKLYATRFFQDNIQNQIVGKICDITLLVAFVVLLTRAISAVKLIATSENNHQTIAVKSFTQLFKIITYIFAAIILISIISGFDIATIFSGLGVLSAIIILVFKDSILGFISGLQIATSKMIKVGDWIQMPKYDLDGTVIEINLLSAKVENWDHTTSTIPTYDLISSHVKNIESMKDLNVRRIKRSLFFKNNSFNFIDPKLLIELKKIDLLKVYLKDKENKLDKDLFKTLTNIGLFRKYCWLYIMNSTHIDSSKHLLVRQRESTPNGLPLEIYCFTNTSNWVEYEDIQSDMFDHFIAISKIFNLELVQTLTD